MQEDIGDFSLLQYGDKQVYLFGIDHEGDNANMKNMINDLQPDHIVLGLCEDRANKLETVISDRQKSSESSGNSGFPPLNCEVYIRPDAVNKNRHKWKTTSIAKDVMMKCGLIYGDEYYQSLIYGKRKEASLLFGDLPIQPTIDCIEEFMNKVEDTDAAKESKKAKLMYEAEKTVGVRPRGRQKASKTFYTRAHSAAKAEMAKLDKQAVITLDNAPSVFVDTEFMMEKYPELFSAVYDERDSHMFECIKRIQGDVIFAVLPQIHVGGVINRLVADDAMQLM